MAENANRDIVQEYIDLKAEIKEKNEQMRALETLILEDHRDDDRITITKGREKIEIHADVYENLKSVGVPTTVTEKRNKALDEFDVDIQKMILDNPDNYTKKVSKESVRVKKQK